MFPINIFQDSQKITLITIAHMYSSLRTCSAHEHFLTQTESRPYFDTLRIIFCTSSAISGAFQAFKNTSTLLKYSYNGGLKVMFVQSEDSATLKNL